MPSKYQNKELNGTYHWSQIQDRKFVTIGDCRTDSLFAMSPDSLKSLGIFRVEYGENIEVPCQLLSYEPYRGKKVGKICNQNYQIIVFDFQYLLEWQARFFTMLNWDMDKIQKFLSNDVLDYIQQRSEQLNRVRYDYEAERLAKSLGVTVEQIDEILKSTKKKDDTKQGKLTKISNEYFMLCDKDDELKGCLFKITKECLVDGLGRLGIDEPKPYLNIDAPNLIFKFVIDDDRTPPKSRGAKGWVKKIRGFA